jgi:hypothetical protein
MLAAGGGGGGTVGGGVRWGGGAGSPSAKYAPTLPPLAAAVAPILR